MPKIQISNINSDGSELLNDSENFLSELEDSEMDEIIGGLSQEPLSKASIHLELEVSGDAHVITTVYTPKEPICYPIKPVCWYPIKPICDYKPIYPIKPFYYPCPVIL